MINVSRRVKMMILTKLMSLNLYILGLQYYYFSKIICMEIEEKKVIVKLFAFNMKLFECLKYIQEQGDDEKELLKVLFDCMIEKNSINEFLQLTFTAEEESIINNFEFPDEKSRTNYFRVRKNFKELNLNM